MVSRRILREQSGESRRVLQLLAVGVSFSDSGGGDAALVGGAAIGYVGVVVHTAGFGVAGGFGKVSRGVGICFVGAGVNGDDAFYGRVLGKSGLGTDFRRVFGRDADGGGLFGDLLGCVLVYEEPSDRVRDQFGGVPGFGSAWLERIQRVDVGDFVAGGVGGRVGEFQFHHAFRRDGERAGSLEGFDFLFGADGVLPERERAGFGTLKRGRIL